MNIRLSLLLPAALAAAIPITAVLAQGAAPSGTGTAPSRPSADMFARLQDGRIAMAKAALRLDDAQLKLWAPVEQHLRTSFAERQKAREARMKLRDERRQARQEGKQDQAKDRPSLTERLDRASQRMAQRAERMKAFSAVFKPFYESLSEEQKAVAGVVLREMRGGHGGMGFRRWAMNREFGPRPQ
jgi:hypothetical protein